MIERRALLTALQRLLAKLEADLRIRASDTPALDADLRAQHAAALDNIATTISR